MEINTKIVMKKGQALRLPLHDLTIKLKWWAAVSLNMVVFYKTKDGRVGGVYPDNYLDGSLGTLNSFPFMQLCVAEENVSEAESTAEDELQLPKLEFKLGKTDPNQKIEIVDSFSFEEVEEKEEAVESEEILRIKKLNNMAEVYICVLNFTDVVRSKNSPFGTYESYLEISDSKGGTCGVPLSAKERGSVAIVAKIDNTNPKGPRLINTNYVTSLNNCISDIPGAKNFKARTKVELKSKGSTFEIQPKTGRAEEILVTLNCSRVVKPSKHKFLGRMLQQDDDDNSEVEFNLGCLYQLRDGKKGAIQMLGAVYGAYDKAPYILHMADDPREVEMEGESIRINERFIKRLKRILFYVFTEEKDPQWDKANPVVSIKHAGSPEILLKLKDQESDMNLCALALFNNTGNSICVSREARFFYGHEDMDLAYQWGIGWAGGRPR